jgi:hypothetical protein
MGEKYDSCGYERDYRQPQIMLSFLPEEYRVMQAWGDAGRSAFSRYDARRDDDVRQACAFVREQLTAAGGDENALLAAAPSVDERLRGSVGNLEQHSAESLAVLQKLDTEDAIPTAELVDAARSNVRRHNKVLDEEIGPLDQLVGEVLGTFKSSALNAFGTQVDEGLNRMRQIAATGTARIFGAIRQRGLADPEGPEAGSAADAT